MRREVDLTAVDARAAAVARLFTNGDLVGDDLAALLDMVKALAAEVRGRREDSERELAYWNERVAEVGSLKRRVTALRRALRQVHRDTTIPVVADTARWARARDEATRRRFEANMRRGLYRGL